MEEAILDSSVRAAFYGSFRRPTAVQRRAEQPLLAGMDAIVLSGTGSGKTVAVLAPLVQKHLLDGRRENRLAILYVVPTKALGNDVVRRISAPMDALGLLVGLRHGDAPRSRKAHRADMAVITPESLDVLVSSGSKLLQGVRALVIDEAHLLYNTQRGLQLSILLRRLERRVGSLLQVVALSATIASPKYLWNFFRPHLKEGRLAVVAGDAGRPIDAAVRIERTGPGIAAVIDRVGGREHFKALAFVNSRRVAERLAAEMQESQTLGDAVFVHHSSISGDRRERTEKEFAARPRALCVATSTLELGIDIGDIDLVILYGLAGGWESFLQRVGRGNRRGRHAKVLCISPRDDRYQWLTTLLFVGALQTARGGSVVPIQPMSLHGAALQQIFSILRERKGGYVRLADIAELLNPWPHLDRSTVDGIADALVEGGFCVRHGFQNRIGAGSRMHELEALRLLWGNFPGRSYQIALRTRGTEIGSVFGNNLHRLSPGRRLRFAGRVWTIAGVRAGAIEVLPAQGRSADVDIGYPGSGVGVDPTLLETVRQMLVKRSWKLDDLVRLEAERMQLKLKELSQTLADAELPYSHENGRYRYLTFAGRLMNEVICRYEKIDDYEVDDLCVWSPRPIDFRQLPSQTRDLAEHAAQSLIKGEELTIFQSMLPPSLLDRDLAEPWFRVPCFEVALGRLVSSTPNRISSDKLRSLLE